jgi:hypothetical protein
VTPSDPEILPSVIIDLELGDTDDERCDTLPKTLHGRFTAPNAESGGRGAMEVNVALLVIPDDLDDWWGTPESKWMRQKVRYGQKAGYTVRIFEHNDHIDGIHEINNSLESRQGAVMSDAYKDKPAPESPRVQTCRRHRRDWFGAFNPDGKLCAYALVIQCGEMLVFSRFLGHGDHRDDGATNVLLYEVVKQRQQESGTRYAVYHRQDNGTEGLQFFKRKMGFRGHDVQWLLHQPGATVLSPKPKPQLSTAQKTYRAAVKLVPGVGALGKKAKGLLKPSD